MKKQPVYTEEFKQRAVKLIREEGYTIAKAGRNLGVSTSTLDNWLKRYKETALSGLNESDREKLKRLEKENRELRMERNLLKEAAVYFAGESKTSTRS